jgi:hypothetical protein
MARKVCDFCLTEGKGLFSGLEKLKDGHYICRHCRSKIEKYGLPVKYDIFQCLVTAQPHMQDMIMTAWLENHSADQILYDLYPLPDILLHEGEHCLNAIEATQTIQKDDLPEEPYHANSIAEIRKKNIADVPSTSSRTGSMKVKGMLYETEVALYFISDSYVNCHRLGHMKRNRDETDRVLVETPTKTFTYMIQHSDLFYMRERFFQKINAIKNGKGQHLIYIRNEKEITITPGVYDIPKSLRPGVYKVKAVRDAGLHMWDALGRVRDYYENEENIELAEGTVVECTGEYELEWLGQNKNDIE